MFRSHMRPVLTLSLSDQIIIVSARSWGADAEEWGATQALLISLFGERRGRAIASDFDEFFNFFNQSAERPVFVGRKGCGRLWADEELFVRAARMCREGQDDCLFDIFFAILPPSSAVAALEVMCRIAHRLNAATRKKPSPRRSKCRTADIVQMADWQRISLAKAGGSAERVA